MIFSLRGKVIYKSNNEIIIDVNGVGYGVSISKRAAEKITDLNLEYTLITYLDVKENSLHLYGFTDEKEREMYKLLISVSGIGPKIAHSILTHLSFEEVISIITNKSFSSQIKIPGIGSKKLELISMSLKDKIYKIDMDLDIRQTETSSMQSNDYYRLEALNALMNLGYQRNEAERIVREVLKLNGLAELSTEELIRKSLEYISK